MRRSETGAFPRIAATVAALGLIAAVVFSDSIGLGPGPGTARFGIISAILATGLLTYGILGSRFSYLFQAIGQVLAWGMLAVLVLETVFFVIARLDPARSSVSPTRDVAPWSAFRSGIMPEPYTGWDNDPSTAATGVVLDASGCRIVPGASTDPAAYAVFVYGADAVLGPSIDDSATIPCFIQEGLDSLWQGPVRVENRARPGWTSTQALIDLVLSLRSGAKPDLVLFIGGFEDAAAAWVNGPGAMLGTGTAAQGRSPYRSGGGRSLWKLVLESTETWGVISSVLSGGASDSATEPVSPESQGAAAAAVFLANSRMSENLGRLYGFNCRFCWLPGVLRSGKALVPSEQAIVDGMTDPGR
ncbi:MAG TPA: hypothetical protein PLY71_08370, partial [Candidatus Fermentibacter daniensis]|nr:hypothetical protein [Candidatus Fermentibacter daniensis]